MKFLVIVLACVVGMAYGQGRSIVNNGIGGNSFPQLNQPTNDRQRTCGAFSSVCYGAGLNAVGAFPVNSFIAQCHAQVAQKYGYLLRIDFSGMMFVTDRYGRNFEDIEIAEPGPAAGFQGQQQFMNQQLQQERMMMELEFCGGQQR